MPERSSLRDSTHLVSRGRGREPGRLACLLFESCLAPQYAMAQIVLFANGYPSVSSP